MEHIIKFSFICFCFMIVLVSKKFCSSKRDWVFHVMGMFFTLVSDFFLVVLDIRYVGVFTFCFVHIFYIMRISQNISKSLKLIIGSFICLSPVYILIDNKLIGISLVYACLFTLDILLNIQNLNNDNSMLPKINRILVLVGLALFALCDVNVLLYNLSNYVDVPEWVTMSGRRLIWIFYAPAQLLLAISGIKRFHV